VLRLVLGSGLKLAIIGVAIGIGGALALSSYVETMLFDIGRFDTPSYIATAAVLLGVSAVACYVPARRAMRVDPLVALRAE
jgi:ABC-type antimicrobial peptide transport system permease subunit